MLLLLYKLLLALNFETTSLTFSNTDVSLGKTFTSNLKYLTAVASTELAVYPIICRKYNYWNKSELVFTGGEHYWRD